MREAAVVIHMEMSKHNTLHIPRTDTEFPQLGPDLLFALNPEIRFESNIGMQRPGSLEEMGPLTGVDDYYAFGMLDGPGVGGKPIGPLGIGEDGEASRQAMPATLYLRRLDADEPSLNGMHLDRRQHSSLQTRPRVYAC
jgi:hypothetical protein